MQKKARPSIDSIQSEALLTEKVQDSAIPAETLDPDDLRSISSELEKHFPQPIEETELVLMEISPHRLHAYWHICPWDLEAASAKTGEKKAQLILRFHDLTTDEPKSTHPPSFDIELSQTTGSQYLEVWADAKRYAAELGLRSQDGLLVDLARSNTVELPRAGHSTSLSANVMTLTPLGDELYLEPPTSQSEFDAISSKNKQTWEIDESQPNDQTLDTRLTKLPPIFPNTNLPCADAQPFEGQPSQADVNEETNKDQTEGIPLNFQGVNPTQVKNIGKSLGFGDSFPLCSTKDLPQARLDEEIISLQSLDETATQLPAGTILPPLTQLPEATLPSQMASTTLQVDTRYEPGPTPISSFSLGGAQEELYMELTIRGRTQPNSQLVFYGRPIPTRADGSFSLTQALPARTANLIAQLLDASLEK